MTMEQITEDVFQIDTAPLGYRQIVASYLVRTTGGVLIIDPGFPCSAEHLVNCIENSGVELHEIVAILLTHTHIDHAGAVGALLEQADNARVIVHKRGAFYLQNGAKITGGSRLVFGSELGERLGEAIDVPEERIREVRDGDSLGFGDTELTVLYTPGHSGDHVSFFEKRTGILLTGDTACLHYPQLDHVFIPAGSPPLYDTDAIISELGRFADLPVRHILTPHYGEVEMTMEAFVEKSVATVRETEGAIRELFARGLEFSQVVEALRSSIVGDGGATAAAAPESLTGVWLRTMVQTGLMGYMANILQYARDIRPFPLEAQATVQ